MRLHTDARRLESHRTPRGPLDHRSHIEGARPGPGARAPDFLADVSASALGAIAGADFFTTEVWTAQGLVIYYTLFVIDLASRRVQILGSTRHPDALFMHQTTRALVFADDGTLARHRVLICDRDAKWTRAVRDQRTEAGLRVVQTPCRAPNANAHAERFVRSIKEECLHRIVPLGERHFRHTVSEFVSHYHRERPHQGCGNALLEPRGLYQSQGRITRRPRLGGMLNFYERAA